MSNCNDCYHCEVCHRRINGIDFLPIIDGKINYRSIMLRECNDVENHCEYFKNKSTTLDLPCKVGDGVYRIINARDNYGYYIEKYEIADYWNIVAIKIYKDEICFVDDSDNEFIIEDIGKTVFLTKEEAEKALEGLKNE